MWRETLKNECKESEGMRGKQRRGAILFLAAAACLAAACGGGGEAAVTATPTPAAVTGEPAVPARTSYLTEEDMETANPWKQENLSSLAAVMKKAAAGEDITIAVLGGSITQGTISDGTRDAEVAGRECYAELFFDWWRETFPEVTVTVINAGIGGTDSYLGVHRVQQDVLEYHPDLVLLEYSVNDGDSLPYKKSYDNLVRRILLSEDAPAVLLLFMAQTNGTSAQNTHALIGFRYGLPMVSYKNLMEKLMESERFTAEELSGDVSHPSVLGHAIVGEMLWRYLNEIYTARDTYEDPTPFHEKALTKESYLNSTLLGSHEITPEELGSFTEREQDPLGIWNGVWTTTDGDGGLRFTVTCKSIGVLFYRTTSARMGRYEVFVDGVSRAYLDAYFQNGWGSYAFSQEIFSSDETATHEIIIRKAEGSEGDDFTLLRLMLSY